MTQAQTLIFENEREKAALHDEAICLFHQGKIAEDHLNLGHTFRQEILSGYVVKSAVRFVSETVGFGLFAETLLKPGAFVGEYVGCVRKNNRHGEMNNYLYSYPQCDEIGRNFVIDASRGNAIRFVNHSQSPNLIPKYAFVDGFYHLILLTLREIHPGEQFSYNYGKKYWIIREPPEPLD